MLKHSNVLANGNEVTAKVKGDIEKVTTKAREKEDSLKKSIADVEKSA